MKGKIQRWGFVVLWCIVIYCFSEFSLFTGENTKRILEAVLTYVPFGHGGDGTSSPLNFIVRKLAHLIEFGILAVLVWRALSPKRAAYVGAWLFATVYAMTDEWHQSFEPGRTAAPKDVAIDSCGALLALIGVFFYMRWKKKKRGPAKRDVS
ncbi:VanZ family protein [Parageobacillus thermoglucosidasius]|uniref:Teicoplanin resistance protein VanZ n=1 Tax=Parageobacillus thermoglucosidasius TaxID=1426 RepID=A0A1B7KQZ0_PARTM|nr:VanZ family protein [Parageobacillus thermoglucosidasius]OAT72494.1 teicoplanin resistance protein VanZ [Parageobacillus thermoglucosidasius]